MNSAELREMLNREPFEPFRLHLSSGQSYDVRDPNSVAVGRNRAIIFHTDRDGWALFSYLHVASVEALANGRQRRTRRKPPE